MQSDTTVTSLFYFWLVSLMMSLYALGREKAQIRNSQYIKLDFVKPHTHSLNDPELGARELDDFAKSD